MHWPKTKMFFRQQAFVFRQGQINVAPQLFRNSGHEFVFAHDRRHVFKHRFTFVRVDPQR